MRIHPIKTRLLHPPKDDLLNAIQQAISKLPEQSILAITSKVVSIGQGRCVSRDDVADKDALIIQEADKYLPRDSVPQKWILHTIKHNIFIPTAGIDASNGDGYYILWPTDPMREARTIWTWLRKTYKVKNIGVVITDSHSVPLRRGTVGIALAYYGFNPLRDYRRAKDLFNRPFRATQANLTDGIAAAAVLAMGEGSECTPLTLITDIPHIKFRTTPYQSRKPYSNWEVNWKEDIYRPFFGATPWKKGKSRT